MVACAGLAGVLDAIHVGPPHCIPPSWETTTFIQWLNPVKNEKLLGGGVFKMKLIGPTNYAGKKIQESFAASFDTCYDAYPNTTYDPTEAPEPYEPWPVQDDQTYGNDFVGIEVDWQNYYSVHISSPCSAGALQIMSISNCGIEGGYPFSSSNQGVTVFPYPSQLRQAFRGGTTGQGINP